MLRSSGVLLSPGSAAAEKVGASTVMVSKTDAASRPITPEQKPRPGQRCCEPGGRVADPVAAAAWWQHAAPPFKADQMYWEAAKGRHML